MFVNFQPYNSYVYVPRWHLYTYQVNPNSDISYFPTLNVKNVHLYVISGLETRYVKLTYDVLPLLEQPLVILLIKCIQKYKIKEFTKQLIELSDITDTFYTRMTMQTDLISRLR